VGPHGTARDGRRVPTTVFTAALLLIVVRPAPVLVFVVAGTAAIALGVTRI